MALWIELPPFIARSARSRFAVLAGPAVLLVFAIALSIVTSSPVAAGGKTAKLLLSPVQASELARTGAITIIDIRRPDEWRTTGIATGAKRATISMGRGTGRFLDRIRKLTNGDKNSPIALICAAGVRSKHAAALLRRRGYTAVADIGEGMSGSTHGVGWIKQGLPVSRCGTC